jgi:elongation factor Ts
MSQNISASMVKELRDRTGVGMMDCKKALQETQGDFEKALLWLRERGIAKAASKSARVAAEGLVELAISADRKAAVVVEVNAETDFVAKNDDFKKFVHDITMLALEKRPASMEELAGLKFKEGDVASDRLTGLVGKIGENMQLRRYEKLTSANGQITGYVHAGGKIATLVALEGATGPEADAAAKDVAMQVAAASPRYLSPAQVDKDELETERGIARRALEEQKKPANVIDKIVDGKINAFYAEVCLTNQAFVKEPKMSVTDYLKGVNPALKIASYIRFQVGEGIEKKKENFAEEVAAQISGNK